MNGADAHWDRVRAAAAAVGIPLVGAAPPVALDEPHRRWREWVTGGNQAGMSWLAADGDIRREPGRWLDGCRAIVVCGFPYAGEPSPGPPRIARYARGEDYHRVARRKLQALLDALQRQDAAIRGRVAVDIAPIMEKPLARLAGLGFIGRNTCLIHPGRLLSLPGHLLLNVPLPPGRPVETGCGDCRRCLGLAPPAPCPATASWTPGAAWRISRSSTAEVIPAAYRGRLADNLFGCDRCQEVCVHSTADRTCPPLPELTGPADTAGRRHAGPDERQGVSAAIRTDGASPGRPERTVRNWAALSPSSFRPPTRNSPSPSPGGIAPCWTGRSPNSTCHSETRSGPGTGRGGHHKTTAPAATRGDESAVKGSAGGQAFKLMRSFSSSSGESPAGR